MLQSAAPGRIAEQCLASVRRTFPDHVPLYLCTLSFGAVTAAVLAIYRLPFPLGSALFFLTMIGQMAVLAIAFAAALHLWRAYSNGCPGSLLSSMLRHLGSLSISGDRFGNAVHGLLTFTPLMMMFAALKPDIARIRPFIWDQPLMHLGVWMGFGTHFWRVLQPWLGHPWITALLTIAYACWFPVMFGCLYWQLARPKGDFTRSQFLLSYAFAWFFGGFVLATIFSSAGPAFYSHVVPGPNPYAPLLQYLAATSRHWPVWGVQLQDDLWHSYITGSGDIAGISAMPSMHVTVATLMALLAWRTNRIAGMAFTAFAGVIVIGSIMLAWHYLADSLAGVALAFAFWGAAGKVTQIWAADRERLFEKPVLAAPLVSEPDLA